MGQIHWFGVYVSVKGCGSKVRLRWRGGKLTLTQVHFPRVSVVLHTSHTAVCVCSETKSRSFRKKSVMIVVTKLISIVVCREMQD